MLQGHMSVEGAEREDLEHQADQLHATCWLRRTTPMTDEIDEYDDDGPTRRQRQQSLTLSRNCRGLHPRCRRWDTSWPCGWSMAPRALEPPTVRGGAATQRPQL